jgi:hypothetical protein
MAIAERISLMKPFHFCSWKQDNYSLVVLQRAGFSAQEIDRLCRFRRAYKPGKQDQAPLDQAHLLFIRWLVKRGRITDEI